MVTHTAADMLREPVLESGWLGVIVLKERHMNVPGARCKHVAMFWEDVSPSVRISWGAATSSIQGIACFSVFEKELPVQIVPTF